MADSLPAGPESAASSREGLVRLKVVKRRRRTRGRRQRRHYVHLAKLAAFWIFALLVSGALAYVSVSKLTHARPTIIGSG